MKFPKKTDNNTIRRFRVLTLVIALVMSLGLVAAASGGSAADPVVSKSYVDGVFFERVIANARTAVESALNSFRSKYISRINSESNASVSSDSFVSATADAVLRGLRAKGKYLYSSRYMAPISLKAGDSITGNAGTMLMAREGSIKCTSGSVISITQGKEITGGTALGRYTTFMFPEGGGKIEVISNDAKVYIDGVYSVSPYEIRYMDEAYAMKELGLVRGTPTGMELARSSTRAECITMLIRLLGEEKGALSGKHAHPFTDVDAWVDPYVGYSYRMGYTKGTSATKYSGTMLTDAAQYMTFILRSLGYSEEAGDFTFRTAVADSVRLGVISDSLAKELSANEFRRDHMMHISYVALSANVKGRDMTLLAKLVANGAVESDAANEFLNR